MKKPAYAGFFMGGAPGRIRTSDHLVRSQVLYPAELRALITVISGVRVIGKSASIT